MTRVTALLDANILYPAPLRDIFHLDLMPGLFCEAVRKIRARLVAPPVSVQDYLATLIGQGLVATAAELAEFSALL